MAVADPFCDSGPSAAGKIRLYYPTIGNERHSTAFSGQSRAQPPPQYTVKASFDQVDGPSCCPVVQQSKDLLVDLHAVGCAYIQMQHNGFLSLVPGTGMTPEATFDLHVVQKASKGRPRVFQLINNQYKKYVLTGHVSGDHAMTVDGHAEPNNPKLSWWTAEKVHTNDCITSSSCVSMADDSSAATDGNQPHSVQYKLQLHAPHIANDWYFYITKEEGVQAQFKLGPPMGEFHDTFQMESPN